jgi:LysM repeat protein
VAALFLVQLVGSETSYTIQKGDSLTKIGARFGVSPEGLADANGFKLSTRLQIGQPLRINSRHIVPSVEGARLVVNIPQQMLFWVSSDKRAQPSGWSAGNAFLIDHVDVAVTETGAFDMDKDFSWSRLRRGDVFEYERLPIGMDCRGFHL